MSGKSRREVFCSIKYPEKIGEKYPNIVVLDADLATATKTINFAKKYPDRFFDMGIAEANMMSTAARFSINW